MIKRFGIYGYECTCQAEFKFFKIIPMGNDYSQVNRLAKDLRYYNLTSFLEVNDECVEDVRQFIFNLQSVLSFIEQKEVLISNLLRESEMYESLDEDYPTRILGNIRCNETEIIISDAISNSSRRIFIDLAIQKFSDKSDSKREVFIGAFSRVVEVFKNTNNFIDVKYYLLFSALESLSREVVGVYEGNCIGPISTFLKKCNLDLVPNNPKDLHRSVSTYVHLRNALFHNGKLEKTVNLNGSKTNLELSNYYSQFQRLLPLVMMKYIGFDDDYINWDSWMDRMMFKAKS